MTMTMAPSRHFPPMRGGRHLPFDVWIHVAKFVPKADLQHLYSVNSAFLDAAFNIRYARVDLHDDGGQLRRILSRLRDPFITHRVRSLRIKPWKVPENPTERVSLRSRLRVRLRSLVDPEFPEFHEKEQLQQRVLKDIKNVMEAISTFTDKIVEYTVDWDEQPYHPLFFSNFLSSFMRLAPSLRKLTLKVPTDQYKALFRNGRLPLTRLEELNIVLSTGYTSQRDIDTDLDCLAVFIHNSFDTLNSLSITTTKSCENLDLSHFFDILGGESRLKKFALSIPLECNHLSAPESLNKVLSDHWDTLQSLVLVTPVEETDQHAPSVSWVVQSIQGLAFPELQTLHLTLSGNSQSLYPVLDCLTSCATTLSILQLEGRAFPHDDVTLLFRYIPIMNGIRRLKLTVKTLSIQLIDLLFTQLTELEDVELVFRRLAGLRSSAFTEFRGQVWNARYNHSVVRRLRLETVSNNTTLPLRAKNMLHPAFERCLPQLEEFFSNTLPTS
ncbi:hypothetical protein ONZ45_g6815 [Pleurotus djamor]|nr:hypothetical protein ONZ45_g6815 [Pleurotus djamor]